MKQIRLIYVTSAVQFEESLNYCISEGWNPIFETFKAKFTDRFTYFLIILEKGGI